MKDQNTPSPAALRLVDNIADILHANENEIDQHDMQVDPLSPVQRTQLREKAKRAAARLIDAEFRAEREEMVAALKRTTAMLRAVCGDLEDGYDLRELRGKYFNAVLEAADIGREALQRAEQAGAKGGT